MYLGAGDDYALGGEGNDTINGDDGDDEIHGHTGADVLNGGAGEDTLHGNEGDDTLEGGAGDDWLTGGSGSDTFIFRPGSGWDGIGDFQAGASGDVLRFHGQSVDNLTDLLTNAEEWGGTTYLHLDGDDVVVLYDVAMNTLQAGNVEFLL